MTTLGGVARLAALVALSVTIGACVGWDGETREATVVSADGTELRATLTMPAGVSPPVGAVLILHGAEAATRKKFAYRMQANVFLDSGLATLMYDKRGAGDSGGDTESSTYADLVEDALAAVEWLRSQPEIDPPRIGIMAASESGWLTPEVAERSGGLAFVINKVGSVLSWRETVAWEIYNDRQADGVSEPSAREQAEIIERIWAHYLSPSEAERAALEAVLAEWADRDDSRLPTELGEPSASYLADIGYDPGPFLDRLETPMLYIYGSEDINIPTRECMARLEELAAGGRPVFSHVYEGEGHELATFGLRPPFYRFLDGYSELLAGFALAHTTGD